MKRTLILLTIAIVSGCATLKPTQRSVTAYFADYREYAEQGFLISPNPYNGEFESIGEIEIVINPAIKETPDKWRGIDISVLGYEDISHNELVSIAVKEAKDRGADAIVNFSITKTPISASSSDGTSITGNKYCIQGFCIKRK